MLPVRHIAAIGHATFLRIERIAMIERIAIISARSTPSTPSQLCAHEFENVLGAMLSAPVVPVMMDTVASAIDTSANFDRLIYVAMNYWQLSRMIERSAALRRRSGTCQAYVFDSFHRYLLRWVDRFPAPLRPAARLMRHELRTLGVLSHVFVPTAPLIEEQQTFLGVKHFHLPIGVDAVRFGSVRTDRTIDVNAYGRQPRALTDLLSDRLNIRDGNRRFHHTDHLAQVTIRDPERHRALFWRTLTDSRIALAYDPEATGDAGRFDCPFVGQRWYESIAAGCAVMGRRPSANEVDQLFDWPEALIELPDDSEAAMAKILALADDASRLTAISRRNHQAALDRHDWRHRVAAMAYIMEIEPDARFGEELSRANTRSSQRTRPDAASAQLAF